MTALASVCFWSIIIDKRYSHLVLALPERRADMIVTDPLPSITHSCYSYTVTSSTLRKCHSERTHPLTASLPYSDMYQPIIAPTLTQRPVDRTRNALSLRKRRLQYRVTISNAP